MGRWSREQRITAAVQAVEARTSGEVVVDARSLETGSRGRDEDMHGKVLESARAEPSDEVEEQ